MELREMKTPRGNFKVNVCESKKEMQEAAKNTMPALHDTASIYFTHYDNTGVYDIYTQHIKEYSVKFYGIKIREA